MNRLEKAYAEQLGEHRLAAQKTLAKTLHVCCGEQKGGPHHPGCHNYEPPEQPTIIDGQESLL